MWQTRLYVKDRPCLENHHQPISLKFLELSSADPMSLSNLHRPHRPSIFTVPASLDDARMWHSSSTLWGRGKGSDSSWFMEKNLQTRNHQKPYGNSQDVQMIWQIRHTLEEFSSGFLGILRCFGAGSSTVPLWVTHCDHCAFVGFSGFSGFR